MKPKKKNLQLVAGKFRNLIVFSCIAKLWRYHLGKYEHKNVNEHSMNFYVPKYRAISEDICDANCELFEATRLPMNIAKMCC